MEKKEKVQLTAEEKKARAEEFKAKMIANGKKVGKTALKIVGYGAGVTAVVAAGIYFKGYKLVKAETVAQAVEAVAPAAEAAAEAVETAI